MSYYLSDYADTIHQLASQYGVNPKLAYALFTHESGGVMDAVSSAGAVGFSQLMPDTAYELGVDIYDPEDNIRGGIMYLSQCMEWANGNTDLALAYYNTGKGQVDEFIANGKGVYALDETRQHNAGTFDAFLRLGGDPNTEWNADGAVPVQMGGNSTLGDYFRNSGAPTNNLHTLAYQMKAEDEAAERTRLANEGFGEKLSDSFLNMWLNNGSIALARLSFFHKERTGLLDGEWRPTAGDVDAVMQALPDAYEAQSFVLREARTQQELNELIQMKQEDLAREHRVDARDYGLHSVGGLAGVVLDPLNFVGFGEATMLAKGMGLLKKASIMGAQGVLANTLDQELAGQYGGYRTNMPLAGALGFVGGAGVSVLASMFKRGVLKHSPTVDKLKESFEADVKARVKWDTPYVEKHHDVDKSLLELKVQRGLKRETISGYSGNGLLDATVRRGLQRGRRFTGDASLQVPEPDLSTPFVKGVPNEQVELANTVAMPKNKHFSYDPITREIRVKSNEATYSDLRNYIENGKFEEVFNKYSKSGRLGRSGISLNLLSELHPNSKQFSDFANYFRNVTGKNNYSNHLIRNIMRSSLQFKEQTSIMNRHLNSKLSDPNSIESLIGAQIVSPKVAFGDDTAQLHSGIVDKVERWLRKSRFTGDLYGRMLYSDNSVCRSITKLLKDPAQNTEVFEIPVEDLIMQSKRVYDRYLVQMQDAYGSFVNRAGHNAPLAGSRMREEFGRRVQQFLEHPNNGEVDPDVLRAASAYKALRKTQLDDLVDNGVVDASHIANAGGAHRRVSKLKRGDFLTKFASEEEARKFLYKYGKAAMNAKHKGIMLERYIREADVENSADLTIRDKSFNEWLDEKIRDWAYGIIDQGESEPMFKTGGKLVETPSFFKAKLPMDTDFTVKMNGEDWSFDSGLRDTDVLSVVDNVNTRTSSIVGFARSGVTNPQDHLSDIMERAKLESDAIVRRNPEKKAEAEEDLRQLGEVLSRLGGAYHNDFSNAESFTLADRLTSLLTDLSYFRNGINMGISALTEHLGLIGNTNMYRVLTRLVPPLDDYVGSLRKAPAMADAQIKDFVNTKMNLDLMTCMTYDPKMQAKRTGVGLSGLSEQMLRTAEDMSFALSKLTQRVSGIAAVTRTSIQTSYISTLGDLASWANGTYSSFLRHNLFSERRLKLCGIHNVDDFKGFVKRMYQGLDPNDEQALTKRLADLEKSEPANYARLLKLLDEESRRNILQPSIGATNVFWKGSPTRRILYQFKDFSRLSLSGHLFRMYHSGEREDIMRFLATGSSGLAVYALRMHCVAYMYYPNDTKKREEFLDRSLSEENCGKMFITRSSVFASLGLADDIITPITGGMTGRTSSQQSYLSGMRNGVGGVIGDAINQAPAVDTLANTVGAVGGSIQDLIEYEQLSNESYQKLINMLPVHRYVPIMAFLAQINDLNYAARDNTPFKKRKQMQKKRDLAEMLTMGE